MSGIAIRAEHLSKQYSIGAAKQRYDTLRDQLVAGVQSLLRRGATRARDDTIWALRDVSLEIRQGAVVGIIGRNGAGKSTLLKVLSRITEPTAGRAEIYGRVGSLLEVGTGFHPELSGRENIYLNGAILGMRKAEIDAKFDAIVAFAEVDRFIDTPVKRYSSGMYVRLAFAVAAHLEPEILFVDEVLAVGDAGFQKKCLGKMGEIATQGRTVVFVSHNMGAVHALTQRCVYMKNGSIAAYDDTAAVVRQYLNEAATAGGTIESEELDAYRRDPRDDTPVRIKGLWVNDRATAARSVEMSAPFLVNIEVEATSAIRGANASVTVYDAEARRVVVLYSGDQQFGLFLSPGRHLIQLRVEDLPLVPGQYFVDVGINQSTGTKAYDVLLKVPLLTITNTGRVVQWLERPWGSVHWDKVHWTARAIEPDAPGS